MASSSSSAVSIPNGLSLNKANSSKLDYLYEVSVEPEVVLPLYLLLTLIPYLLKSLSLLHG